MSCRSFEPMIALAVEGDLPAADGGRLERHLRSCAACRAFAEELRSSQRAVRELAREPVDDEVLARVRAGVLGGIERRDRRRPLVFRRPLATAAPRWLAAAAGLLLVLGAAIWALRSGVGPRTPEAPGQVAWAPSEPGAPTAARPGSPPEPAAAEPAAIPSLQPPAVASRPSETAPATPAVVAPSSVPGGFPEVRRDAEPMVIKWVTEDPDLVIYWLVDADETPEETNDAISEV